MTYSLCFKRKIFEFIKGVMRWGDSILIFRLCLVHICVQAAELCVLIPNHNNKINVMTVTKLGVCISCQEREEKSLYTVQFSTKQ